MAKITAKTSDTQEKLIFSLPTLANGKATKVDFDSPSISSNGGLLLLGGMHGTLAEKIGSVIPDFRDQRFVVHSYRDQTCQRVAQIMCGYEDADDCDALRGDISLKTAVGRGPSGTDLASQPTMTRLENHIDRKTLFVIAYLFIDHYTKSFSKAPKHVILDVDDTNFNTFGCQQLTLFNNYYHEYCYMPLLVFDGISGQLILPLLRPGRTGKGLNVAGLLRRLIEYLHEVWPRTIFELRGDSHFSTPAFMDWAYGKWYVRYITGLASNSKLMDMVEKQVRRAENDFKKQNTKVVRYFKLTYQAKSWKHEQRVVAKIEITQAGTNVRFVVTSNKNNTAEYIYRRYCKRGNCELWIKDFKFFRADKMSCNSYSAKYFRLFLYGAAYVMTHKLVHGTFARTQVEKLTVDSFIRRIMLSAVYIVEKKTFVRFSFSPHHRYRDELAVAFQRLAA